MRGTNYFESRHTGNIMVKILFSKVLLNTNPRAKNLLHPLNRNRRAQREDFEEIIVFNIKCYLPKYTNEAFNKLKEGLIGKKYLPYENIKLVEFYYKRLNPKVDDGDQKKIEWKTSTTNSLWVIYTAMRK